MPATLDRIVPGWAGLRSYRARDLGPDLVAGLSVAAVALPVGIAYADIAQAPAVVGIYSAIFPLFAYALFGSSRQLMIGPDAATCIMAASAVAAMTAGDPQHHAALMVALTLTTGVFYLVSGMMRLGFLANFLSQPILVGYLNGIALMVLIGQLPKLFGFAPRGGGFLAQVAGFFGQLRATNPATLVLGLCLLALLLTLRRFAPRVPAPLVVAAAGMAAVAILHLADRGVAVLGAVPAGVPAVRLPTIAPGEIGPLLQHAAGLTLISFTSGVLTSKSFARRSGDDVDANRELIGFGAGNLVSGLAQGFPVTGADSRTAVNVASGGRSQLAGIVAGGAMLGFLLFLTAPLAHLPTAALAAIIIVSATGLFDLRALRTLLRASGREWTFSVITTVGVLLLGVLPGVMLAIGLSLLWLLWLGSRPHDAVLGRVPGMAGLHDIELHPGAGTIPGLLIFRFDSNLVFFNCDRFKERVRARIAEAAAPVECVVIDASPINVVDYTAVQGLTELRKELEGRGVRLAFARAKESLRRYFRQGARTAGEHPGGEIFETVEAAITAFEGRPSGPDNKIARPG